MVRAWQKLHFMPVYVCGLIGMNAAPCQIANILLTCAFWARLTVLELQLTEYIYIYIYTYIHI